MRNECQPLLNSKGPRMSLSLKNLHYTLFHEYHEANNGVEDVIALHNILFKNGLQVTIESVLCHSCATMSLMEIMKLDM